MTPFLLLCVTGFLSIFSSTISKSPVLPLFATRLGADPSGVGAVAAVSAFTGVVFSIPAGILSDRIGRRRMLLISSFIFGTAPFLYLFISTIWQLAAVRFYHGFATAIFMPVAMAMVSGLSHEKSGERLGWFSTSTLAGRFLAPIIGGAIIGTLLLNPLLSYRIVYLVCGSAGALALMLAFFLPAKKEAGHESLPWRSTWAAFKTIMSNRVIITTCTVEAAILFAYGTFETFMPLYSIGIGLSPYEVGIFLSAQVITLALSKPFMGRFSDRHGRRPQIIFGALLGAFCIGSFSLSKTFVPLLLISIAFGLSLSIVTSASSAYIADLSSRQSRGSAMGLLGSIMDIGHTAGPVISGIVASSFGFGLSFTTSALVLVLACVIFTATRTTV